MNQAQPATTTPEAALGPLSGRKTATGVFDTWSRSNLRERQAVTKELRWGVRYGQADPIGYCSAPKGIAALDLRQKPADFEPDFAL
jgi:hypothetical protein